MSDGIRDAEGRRPEWLDGNLEQFTVPPEHRYTAPNPQAEKAEAELAAAQARIAELEGAIEVDRTRICDAVQGVLKAMRSRFWLTEGRGSYEWNDDTFRTEFQAAYEALCDAIRPLQTIASDLSNCPNTRQRVIDARTAGELRAENARLRAALETVDRLAGELDCTDAEGRCIACEIINAIAAAKGE